GWNVTELGEGVKNFFASLECLPDRIQLMPYVKENGANAFRLDMEITQAGINICNTYIPFILISLTGLAFKNGLYIFMLRQFFRGVPDELEESAYMDGAGTFRTFMQIILPLSVPMMVTVFLFAFCWQWTDTFYTGVFFNNSNTNLLVDIVAIPPSLKLEYAGQSLYYTAIRNTCGLLIIMPLVVLYAFGQKFLVQGIENSGLAN
ncbi:MAG: carbohydrate ABC transporter permease, partial [Clostridia bacterium]|nr:carbohydrate ABC transporter permease [Clostridia bacterium]